MTMTVCCNYTCVATKQIELTQIPPTLCLPVFKNTYSLAITMKDNTHKSREKTSES